jgi:hypothetical protein
MNYDLLKKNAEKKWGKGWRELSTREQQREMCYQFAVVVLSQHDTTAETLAELKELSRAVLKYNDKETDHE